MPSFNKSSRNERRKLTATALNNLAVSFIVTGLIVPSVSLAYQLSYPRTGLWWLFAILWFISGLTLHVVARILLGGVEE